MTSHLTTQILRSFNDLFNSAYKKFVNYHLVFLPPTVPINYLPNNKFYQLEFSKNNGLRQGFSTIFIEEHFVSYNSTRGAPNH